MLKTRFAAAAASLILSTVIAAPASAAKITYTYASTFIGTNDGRPLTIDATFTAVGDTDDTLSVAGGFPAVNITSFTALVTDGLYTISTPIAFAWNNQGGIAGFSDLSGDNIFAFQSSALVDYDGISDLGPITTTAFFTDAQFGTDRGVITLTGQSAGTFSAAISPVPEPSTWALMIVGFGAIGGAMRRRRSVTARVRLA